MRDWCWAWRELPVPVVAVLHGHCFGGGLQVALAADFRFATPDCELSVMEAKWGLITDMTGSVTLRELVGMDVAKRLVMTAEVIDGNQALAYGLVTGVADDPLKEAEALVGQLLTRSPDAPALTKRVLHDTWTKSPRWAFWTETVLQARLMRSANTRIARAANLDRETPHYVTRSLRCTPSCCVLASVGRRRWLPRSPVASAVPISPAVTVVATAADHRRTNHAQQREPHRPDRRDLGVVVERKDRDDVQDRVDRHDRGEVAASGHE